MICPLTNNNGSACTVLPLPLLIWKNPVPVEVEETTRLHAFSSGRPTFSVETGARIELSLVPEVERVFFEREGDGEFRIISVVNKRDAVIREKVYAREEAIMQAYPGLNFDFHVVARMDRKVEDVLTKAGKLVFER
jgi:hypothetical protein